MGRQAKTPAPGRRPPLVAAGVIALLALAVLAPGAAARITPTLHDPASCDQLEPAPGLGAIRCDDGVPAAGGASANEGGVAAVTVPAKYEGYKRLPRRAGDAGAVPGADAQGNVALDVDITLPARRARGRGFPLLFLMHGCCAGSKTGWQADTVDAPGERWHYSDAWFAARGYAVVTYTARGFVNGDDQGSTGQTQLDSRAYEINDFQHLACQVSQRARLGDFDDVTGKRVRVNPRRVVATGGSYGGGFSWLALTDPRWRCPSQLGSGRANMRLAAVAPKYGWTDLVHSLVPTGDHSQRPGRLPDRKGCDSGPLTFRGVACEEGAPVGLPKRSIVAGLYASGKTGVPPGSSHTTFPAKIDDAIACLQGVYPPAPGPLCDSTISQLLPEFLRERSAYYQNRFFRKIEQRPGWRVPVFSAATFTDPLFPPVEHVRFTNRLRDAVPGYPIKTYQGDYQHFVQNKAKEWGDVCAEGDEREVCTAEEYARGFDRKPAGRVLTGATTLLNRFVDHYARPPANRRQREPRFNVIAALQVCPENAGADPADEPGARFRARTFGGLTAGTLRLDLDGDQTTTSAAAPNQHALDTDPVANSVANGGRCAVHTDGPGAGVASYQSAPLEGARTVIGPTRVRVEFDVLPPTAAGVQLDARIYDVDGAQAVLVDRGPRVLAPDEVAAGEVEFETHGNGWRFAAGHQVRIELAQDDDPFIHRSDSPAALSSVAVHGVDLALPTREP